MKTKLFQKVGVDICNPKSMFEFINNHFKYWTMNSWNRLKSIANNVKLYNLNLDGDWGTVLDYLYDEEDIGDLQYQINEMISNWEDDHPGYSLGFNGRSSGYLVIYNKEYDKETDGVRINFRNILPDDLVGFDTYEEFKESIKDYCGWTMKNMIPELRKYTQLIRDFDKLCDNLRELVNDYSKLDYKAEKALAEAD